MKPSFYNNKDKTIYFFIFLACSLALSVSIFRHPVSFDAFWHLSIGRDILENGLSYAFNLVDEYSYSFPGQEYHSTWMFDVFFALIVSLTNVETGFYIIKLIFISLFLFFLYQFFRINRINWRIALLTIPFIIAFFQFRTTVRPELLSYSFIMISLIFYTQTKKNFNNINLAKISILLLFWLNYHSPIFGYVIFFGLFIDKIIEKISGKNDFSWSFWIAWGGVIFLLGFLNPQFSHFLLAQLFFDYRWVLNIQEWRPTLDIISNDPRIYVLFLINIYLAMVLFYQKKYGFFLIIVISSIAAFQMVRMIAFAAIISLSILSITLNAIDWKKISSTFKPSILYLSKATWLLLVIFSFSSLNNNIQVLINNNDDYANLYPKHIVQYLKKKNQPGNIFNLFDIGGYLTYHLRDYPINIDGRTNILYPYDYYKHYWDIQKSASLLSETIDKDNIQYVLYQNNPINFEFLKHTNKLSVDYLSDYFLLMSTKNPSFPISGQLLFHPACWTNNIKNNLSQEINKRELLPDGSALKQTLELIKNNNIQYINQITITPEVPAQFLRIAAYISSEHQLWKKASDFLSMINSSNTYLEDWFMQSYYLAKAGFYDEAEKILAFVFFTKKDSQLNQLSDINQEILLKILLLIKKNQPLKKFTNEQISLLQKEKAPSQEILKKIICENYGNNIVF